MDDKCLCSCGLSISESKKEKHMLTKLHLNKIDKMISIPIIKKFDICLKVILATDVNSFVILFDDE